jgi:cytochrome c551/c552
MCHSIDQKLVGPALGDVTKRREPEWIMNMMLNPDGMAKENEAAKSLLIEYNNVPMINQHLSEKEARAILEYLRSIESK